MIISMGDLITITGILIMILTIIWTIGHCPDAFTANYKKWSLLLIVGGLMALFGGACSIPF